MTIPPWQLALRFALEVTSLIGLGRGASRLWPGTGPVARWALALGVPAIAAALWVTFAVRGDPSRSGNAPIPVAGWLRLALELAIFGGGAAGLAMSSGWVASGAFLLLLAVHHVGTTERLDWLLRQ